MNSNGLAIALAVGGVVGVTFGLWPHLDIALTRPFFDETYKLFMSHYSLIARYAREFFQYGTAALVAPAFIALIVKVVLPRRRMLISGRAVVYLIATLALAPGLVTNVILKDNWSRPRPIDITEFNGTDRFVAWWDPRGSCEKNCSFVAGEGAGAFWTFAPASLAPPVWRPITYAAALAFGTAAGGFRIAGGAHFFSDVAFSGVFTFLIIWLTHGLIYRWPRTRITDEQVERAIERVALPPHLALMRLIGRKAEGKP